MTDARELARNAYKWELLASELAYEHDPDTLAAACDALLDAAFIARAVLADDTADRKGCDDAEECASRSARHVATLRDRLARAEAENEKLRKCDCVHAPYSSQACMKCGRRGIVTREQAANRAEAALEARDDARAIVSRYLRIRAEHVEESRQVLIQLAADIDHSDLLERMLRGEEPLRAEVRAFP